MNAVRKAIFPVGGLGTRFLPATKALPKEMLPVVDKPLIEYAVDEARAAGIEEFIFVAGRGKSAIQDHFDRNAELESILVDRGLDDALDVVRNPNVEPGQGPFVRQNYPLGLGHAVWCARSFVRDEAFAVLLADDLILSDRPTLSEMMDVYHDHGGNVVSLEEVPLDQTSRYGVIAPGESNGRLVEVTGLVEKPDRADAPSNLAIVGRYILQPAVMDHLETGTVGAGHEIQLTDSMAALIGAGAFHGLRIDGTRFDCGTKEGLIEANIAFGLQRKDLDPELRTRLQKVLDAF